MSLILDQVDAGVLGGVVINPYDRFSKLLNGINILIGKIKSNDSDLLHIDEYKELELALTEASDMLPYVGGSAPHLINSWNSTVENAESVGVYAPSATREVVTSGTGENTQATGEVFVSVGSSVYSSPRTSDALNETISNTTPAPTTSETVLANTLPVGAGFLILGALYAFSKGFKR